MLTPIDHDLRFLILKVELWGDLLRNFPKPL